MICTKRPMRRCGWRECCGTSRHVAGAGEGGDQGAAGVLVFPCLFRHMAAVAGQGSAPLQLARSLRNCAVCVMDGEAEGPTCERVPSGPRWPLVAAQTHAPNPRPAPTIPCMPADATDAADVSHPDHHGPGADAASPGRVLELCPHLVRGGRWQREGGDQQHGAGAGAGAGRGEGGRDEARRGGTGTRSPRPIHRHCGPRRSQHAVPSTPPSHAALPLPGWVPCRRRRG